MNGAVGTTFQPQNPLLGRACESCYGKLSPSRPVTRHAALCRLRWVGGVERPSRRAWGTRLREQDHGRTWPPFPLDWTLKFGLGFPLLRFCGVLCGASHGSVGQAAFRAVAGFVQTLSYRIHQVLFWSFLVYFDKGSRKFCQEDLCVDEVLFVILRPGSVRAHWFGRSCPTMFAFAFRAPTYLSVSVHLWILSDMGSIDLAWMLNWFGEME